MINVSTEAVVQIQHAAEQAGAQGMALRVAARRDADGSIQYGMGFDQQAESDAVVDADGVIVVVAPESQALLAGAMLDFVELHPGDYQFIFINPNDTGASCASGGCASGGCGSGACR